jgi:hypothetical protein
MSNLGKNVKKYGGYLIGPGEGYTQQKLTEKKKPTDQSRAGFTNWQSMPARTPLGGSI